MACRERTVWFVMVLSALVLAGCLSPGAAAGRGDAPGLVRLGGDSVSLGDGVTVAFTEFVLEEFATSPCERSSGSVETAFFRIRVGEEAHEWGVRVDTGLDETYTVAGLTLRVVGSDFTLVCEPWVVFEMADEAGASDE